MRILVTGGTGQIGGAVIRALVDRGDDVRALVRDAARPGHLADLDLELHQGDVTQAESLESACVGIDAVIHSAGCISYWKKGHARMNAVNVEGTRNLLESATRAGVGRFVHTSSMACFGYVAGHLLALEKGRDGERYFLGGHPMSWEAVFQMAAKVVDAPPPPRKVSRGLMMTMARLQMLGGWCTGVEPKITPQMVEISSRNRMYDCSKAKEELGYSISDLENSMNLAWDWYQSAHLG